MGSIQLPWHSGMLGKSRKSETDLQLGVSDEKPCPGDFSFNSTFPVQEGEELVINYTVTGEQRFYDFWSETAPAQGYNVSN